ncbi:S-layer homology domain-containing protein [Agathobaculum hominis]
MSKKRTIRRRGLSAVLSVLLCLSMLPMGALAEEPDGSEDAARNTIVEKADTENIENTTDNDAVVEDAIVENAVVESDAVASSDDADADAQDIDALDIDADAVDVQAVDVQTVNVQAAAAEHAHPICGSGDTCTDPNHASHEIITDWQPIGSESELWAVQANGHYYLTDDVVFDSDWRCDTSIVLCLNGHSITFKNKGQNITSDGIWLASDTNFTICDCSKNQTGKITGSTCNGVDVYASTAVFNMYGGKITGNNNKTTDLSAYGGGVRVRREGTFNMYGGEISGNTCAGRYYSYGGGVCVEDKGSIFNMYGGKITGNTAGNGNDVALYGYGRMCLSGAPILGDIYLVHLDIDGIDVGEGGLAENTTYQINFAGMESPDMVFHCIGTMSEEDAGHFPAPSGTKYDQGNPWSAWYNGEQLFFVRESAKHQGGIHPICGDGAACTAPDHAENHENIAWTPIEYIHTETHGTEEWIEPGNYYLTKDTILANSAYSRMIVVTGDVKICLNGHTLKYRPRTTEIAGLCRIYLRDDASFSICDCSKGQTGKIVQISDDGNTYSALFQCLRNSTLNLFGGEISGGGSSKVPDKTAYPGAVKLYGGTFNMYGGKITNCTTNAQSVIDVDSSSASGLYYGEKSVPGVFNMYGGEISGNRMTPYKGQHNTAAIDATRNNVNIYGGKICNNTAVGNDNVAHGIDVIWSDLTISGGEITGNSGYGVWMTNKTPATALSGGKITGNAKGNFCFAFQRTSDYVSSTAVLDENMAPDTNIGITISPLEADKAPYTLSEACDTDNSRFFHSDMAGYAVIYDEESKTLQLQKGTALTGTLEINGAAKFGQELAATLTGTNNTGTLTYKWYRSGEDVPIATDTDKYTLTADDIGKTITAMVKSSAELGSITAVTKVVEKADGPAAPAAFTLGFALNDDQKTFTATIPEVKNAEYSFDGKQYSAVNTKTDCAPNTEYTGYVRIPETDTQKASAVTSSTQTAPKLTVAAPVFKPDGATSFRGTQTVEISCATPGASIYYTTDGTTPTSNSTAYNGAISLTSTTTIKAIAVKADMNDSAVAEATFTRRSSSGGGGGGGGGGGFSAPSYSVSVDDVKHGTVTVSPESASKGDTVTITVTPDKGYTLESLTVLDKDGKALALTDKGGGRYTFTMPAGKITVKAVFMDDNTMLNFFTDVHAEDYYYDAVLWAAQKGITGGTSDTLFAPNAACTRAQAVTFLWRAAGSPEPKTLSSFADVPTDAYYAKAVAWAVENGVAKGVSDTAFAPNTGCTRAQIVTFLWRAQQSPASDGENPFTDVPAAAYYYNAVLWAVENDVAKGVSETAFAPNDNCTRAQIVTMIYRCRK